MKAATFDYQRPQNIEQALALKADDSIEGVFIAGGQTLVPMMASRLATPQRLIDIARIKTMAQVEFGDNRLAIGAALSQAKALSNPLIERHAPLLTAALPWVGHQQTRNRGTIGGSLCTADPAAEIPLVATILDGTMIAGSDAGQRSIKAADFFRSALTTALTPVECLLGIELPDWAVPAGSKLGIAVREMNMRSSDFAIVSAMVQLIVDADGRCSRIACGIGGVGDAPLRAVEAEQALTDAALGDDDIDAACSAVRPRLQPYDDIHASAQYRRRVAPQLLARAIRHARDHAANVNQPQGSQR